MQVRILPGPPSGIPTKETHTSGTRRSRDAGGVRGTRTERREQLNRHRREWLIPALSVLGVAVVLLGVGTAIWLVATQRSAPAVAVGAGSPLPSASIETTEDGTGTVVATDSVGGGIEVEVPDLVGQSVEAADAVLQAAGLAIVTRVAESPVVGVPAGQVLSQDPAAGGRVPAGAAVTLTYQPQAAPGAAAGQLVVCIDPGHQQRADTTPEPVGPGSAETKPKVSGGATGVATHVPEYKLTLAIALKVRDRLQAKGVKVVMTRTTDDVNIANSARARIANESKAALFLRIHCDGSDSQATHGISTLYPAGNNWVTAISAPSKLAAEKVLDASVKATGAQRLKVTPRSDMSGFNYSKVPSTIIECGFLSNAVEDRNLNSPAYQDKLADGIARGVLDFLGR